MIINRKTFYDQAINSDIKRYDKIRKLTTGQGADCTTGCLLDYDYMKYHYRLIAVDLSTQKELDANPKAVQQIEFNRQLQNEYGINADGTQSVFISTNLEKIKKARLKLSQGSVTIL